MALILSLIVLAACGVEPGVTAQRSDPIGPVPTEIVDPLDDLSPPDTSDAQTDGAPESVPADATTQDTPTTTAPATPPTTEPIDRLPGSQIGIGDVVDIGDAKTARSYDDFVAAALTDIQEWWTREFPIVYGEPYRPLEGGIWAAYSARTDELPGCGEQTTDYRDVNQFAAFYCGLGDFMIYDDGSTSLLGQLSNDFGEVVMGVVLAHEFGHAIQFRVGAFDRPIETIYTEQQADCFSGAWVGQAYRGESANIRLNDADVRGGLIAMISVRDPVGTSQFDVAGHGSAFDRVGAFQVGFREGPARCALLLDEPLPLVPNEFQPNSTDQLRGGNAPYDCTNDSSTQCQPAYEFLAADLNAFWADALAPDDFDPLVVDPVDSLGTITCDDPVSLPVGVVACPSTNTVYFDEPAMLNLYFEFGDFTLGYALGAAWAEIAQIRIESPLAGEERALLNDCFAGAWVKNITPVTPGQLAPSGRDAQSSPGDLDEAIRTTIIVGDNAATDNIIGSPFEKIDAFRSGVLNGFDACASSLPD